MSSRIALAGSRDTPPYIYLPDTIADGYAFGISLHSITGFRGIISTSAMPRVSSLAYIGAQHLRCTAHFTAGVFPKWLLNLCLRDRGDKSKTLAWHIHVSADMAAMNFANI